MSIRDLKIKAINILHEILPKTEAESFITSCHIEDDKTQVQFLIEEILRVNPNHSQGKLLQAEFDKLSRTPAAGVSGSTTEEKCELFSYKPVKYKPLLLPPLPDYEFRFSPFVQQRTITVPSHPLAEDSTQKTQEEQKSPLPSPLLSESGDASAAVPPLSLNPVSSDQQGVPAVPPVLQHPTLVDEYDLGQTMTLFELRKPFFHWINLSRDYLRACNTPLAEQSLLKARSSLLSNPAFPMADIKAFDKVLNHLIAMVLKFEVNFKRIYFLSLQIIAPQELAPLQRHLYLTRLLLCQSELFYYKDFERVLMDALDLVQQQHPDIHSHQSRRQIYGPVITLCAKLTQTALLTELPEVRQEMINQAIHLLERYLNPGVLHTVMTPAEIFSYFLSLGQCHHLIGQFGKAKLYFTQAQLCIEKMVAPDREARIAQFNCTLEKLPAVPTLAAPSVQSERQSAERNCFLASPEAVKVKAQQEEASLSHSIKAPVL